MNRAVSACVFCAPLAVLSATASADFTVYRDRAEFNAAAASLGTIIDEGYESYPDDPHAGARTIHLNQFDVSYDLNGDNSDFGVSNELDLPNGIGPTAGNSFLRAEYPSIAVPSATVTFKFPGAINAFGTDIRDLENDGLNFATDTGATGLAGSGAANGAIQFFGIISTNPFTSIGLTEPGVSSGDGVVFDETVHVDSAAIVPEPSPALLFLPVLPLLLYRVRRRIMGVSF
jgi:hypothetical protein